MPGERQTSPRQRARARQREQRHPRPSPKQLPKGKLLPKLRLRMRLNQPLRPLLPRSQSAQKRLPEQSAIQWNQHGMQKHDDIYCECFRSKCPAIHCGFSFVEIFVLFCFAQLTTYHLDVLGFVQHVRTHMQISSLSHVPRFPFIKYQGT